MGLGEWRYARLGADGLSEPSTVACIFVHFHLSAISSSPDPSVTAGLPVNWSVACNLNFWPSPEVAKLAPQRVMNVSKGIFFMRWPRMRMRIQAYQACQQELLKELVVSPSR